MVSGVTCIRIFSVVSELPDHSTMASPPPLPPFFVTNPLFPGMMFTPLHEDEEDDDGDMVDIDEWIIDGKFVYELRMPARMLIADAC